MKNYSWLRRSLVKISLFFSLALFLSFGFQLARPHLVLAQSDTAIRSEISSLRTRVARLENEIRSRQGGQNKPSGNLPEYESVNPPQAVNGVPIGASDPMFERLATLTIEIKERVNALEKRVNELEQTTALLRKN
jgi:hypothetical protein